MCSLPAIYKSYRGGVALNLPQLRLLTFSFLFFYSRNTVNLALKAAINLYDGSSWSPIYHGRVMA